MSEDEIRSEVGPGVPTSSLEGPMETACAWICGLALIATLVITAIEVVSRAMFHFSLQISDDFGGYLLVAMTFISLAYCQVTNAFHRIELVQAHMQPRPRQLLSLAFLFLSANMIGAGIFTTSGLLMEDLHNSPLMLVLWLVGGLVALCGAWSYAELGAAMPEAGGEYAFLSRMYHPLLGFLSGWVSLIAGFSAPIAASAIGCSEYLFSAFPGMLPENLDESSMKRLISLFIIAAFTGIHMRGIEFGARVQNGLTGLKVLLIAGLIVIGFAAGRGDWSNLVSSAGFSLAGANWQTIGLSLMWIMFAYSGWNAATYIGSEVKNPTGNIPLSLLLGTGIVTVIYMLLNLFYVYAVHPQVMEGVISIGGLAVGQAFGEAVGSLSCP